MQNKGAIILLVVQIYFVGLAIGQTNHFKFGFNSGFGLRAKQNSVDTTCNPNLYTGANCISQYYQMEQEWYNQILGTYNFSIKKFISTRFSAGFGTVFYRTRVGLIPAWEQEFHIRYPNELTDSIIHWHFSPIVQVGIVQELLRNHLDFIFNFYIRSVTKKYSKFYGNNNLIAKQSSKIGGIYHLQTGLEYSISTQNRITFIWDVPIFFNSGYRSSKWIFMLGYSFNLIKK